MKTFNSEYDRMQYIAGLQGLSEASKKKSYEPPTKTVPNPNAGKWRIMSTPDVKPEKELGGGKFFDSEKEATAYADKHVKSSYRLVQLGKTMKVYSSK